MALCLYASGLAQSAAPRIWCDKAVKDWATPIAAVGVCPGHFSECEYYAVPVDNYQTYPVYHPDRELEASRQCLRYWFQAYQRQTDAGDGLQTARRSPGS